MKSVKIALWIGISFAFGKGLNLLLSPSEVIYSFMLFVFPFILMGFQQDLETTRSLSSIFGKRIYVRTQTFRIKTFWGIPIGQSEASDAIDEWFPDTTPKEVLELVSSTTEILISSVIRGIFKDSFLARKATSSSR